MLECLEALHHRLCRLEAVYDVRRDRDAVTKFSTRGPVPNAGVQVCTWYHDPKKAGENQEEFHIGSTVYAPKDGEEVRMSFQYRALGLNGVEDRQCGVDLRPSENGIGYDYTVLRPCVFVIAYAREQHIVAIMVASSVPAYDDYMESHHAKLLPENLSGIEVFHYVCGLFPFVPGPEDAPRLYLTRKSDPPESLCYVRDGLNPDYAPAAG